MVDVDASSLLWLTAEQMSEVDRVAIEDFGVDLVRMMENAGRGMADVVLTRYRAATVTVLAGSGGNGGGGLVAARHLHNRGVDVSVVLSKPDRLRSVPARQHEILERIGVPTHENPRDAEVILDALVGYSLSPPVTGRTADLVHWANDSAARVVSLDVPTGLDATSGEVLGAVVRADCTLTLAMPKVGLRGAEQVGDLLLADISVPPEVYHAIGLELGSTPFAGGAVVRVTGR